MDTLLAWLAERRCSTVLLDASGAGAPLYLRYSFVEDDRTLHMGRVHTTVVSSTRLDEALRLKD